MLEIIGLRDAGKKKYSQNLLGMNQWLGIGWAVPHDPELLVLDEPANSLDPAGMQDARHLIFCACQPQARPFSSPPNI